MKQWFCIAAAAAIMALLCGCGAAASTTPQMEPQVSQMRSICELAVMDCYSHNVAKYKAEDAEGLLWWKKDKHFWIEYSGVVTVGVDVSKLEITVDGQQVTITMPPAQVQACWVDSSSLTPESYIVAKDSAPVRAADETLAFRLAQEQLEQNAAGNTALLSQAQQSAETLLTNYINSIGAVTGQTYQITFNTLPAATSAPKTSTPSVGEQPSSSTPAA